MSPKTILLIDDEYVTLAILEDILSTRGYRIISATRADTGFREAVQVRPDLIILDIILPDKDGFAVLAELKKDERTSDIPVILLSALSQSRAFESTAAVAFIHKPINADRILALVEQIIGSA